MCVALCGSESGLGPSTRVCRHRKCIQPIHPPSKVVTVEVRYMCVCTHSICIWQPRRQGAVFMEVAEHRELNNVESTHCLCKCFSGLYISSFVPRVAGFALTDGSLEQVTFSCGPSPPRRLRHTSTAACLCPEIHGVPLGSNVPCSGYLGWCYAMARCLWRFPCQVARRSLAA